MRITHILLSRGFAGTERATAEMCNAHCGEHVVSLIVKRGHRGAGGASILDHLDPRVQVVEVRDHWQQRPVARAIETLRPEVIHAHLRRSTRLLARIRPTAAVIATLHLTVNGPHFAAMDGLICIAQWQRRALPRGYRGSVFFINESMIPAPRLNTAQRDAVRSELGARPGDYLIGGVGRLAHSKGFDVLIAAFAQAQLPNARLVIIGDGRERRRLERLAAATPGVHLPGFRDDVKPCYQAFDLFVSPSRSEPLGRVVLEALDAGVPVIATATDGPSEILRTYCGDLVPLGDASALAGRLCHHCERRTPPQHHDLRAYDIETVAAATLQAYQRLIEAGTTVTPV